MALSRRRLLVLPLLFILLAGAVLWLLELRFETGDVYSPYSSMRSDPLGSKALFEALRDQPGLTVTRNFRDELDPSLDPGGKALLLLGVDDSDFLDTQEGDVEDIEDFAKRGGRVVLTFTERMEDASGPPPGGGAAPATAGGSGSSPTAPKAPASQRDDVRSAWGLSIGLDKLPEDHGTYRSVKVEAPGGGLPPLPWHTALYFIPTDAAWKTVYAREGRPVVIERDWGRGQVVLCLDSYLLSNEAADQDREGAFLAWLLGPVDTVIFDETHLGVEEDPNLATLARDYGLGGVAAGFLVLALLFVWRSFFSLVPPQPDEAGDRTLGRSGKDDGSGFVNLLRRNIPRSRILAACLAEWKKSFAGRRDLGSRVEEMERALGPEGAGSYERLRSILHGKGPGR